MHAFLADGHMLLARRDERWVADRRSGNIAELTQRLRLCPRLADVAGAVRQHLRGAPLHVDEVAISARIQQHADGRCMQALRRVHEGRAPLGVLRVEHLHLVDPPKSCNRWHSGGSQR